MKTLVDEYVLAALSGINTQYTNTEVHAKAAVDLAKATMQETCKEFGHVKFITKPDGINIYYVACPRCGNSMSDV